MWFKKKGVLTESRAFICQHSFGCEEQGVYDVVIQQAARYSGDGSLMDADPDFQEATSAYCAECGAKAKILGNKLSRGV